MGFYGRKKININIGVGTKFHHFVKDFEKDPFSTLEKNGFSEDSETILRSIGQFKI